MVLAAAPWLVKRASGVYGAAIWMGTDSTVNANRRQSCARPRCLELDFRRWRGQDGTAVPIDGVIGVGITRRYAKIGTARPRCLRTPGVLEGEPEGIFSLKQ